MQGLLDSLVNSHGWRIPDYQCEICNKVGFCATSTSVSNIAKILIGQLAIFRYDPMNNRSRELIPNLMIDDTVTLFVKLSIHGIIWHHGPNVSSGHYTGTFKVNGKCFCKWCVYSRDRLIFLYINL